MKEYINNILIKLSGKDRLSVLQNNIIRELQYQNKLLNEIYKAHIFESTIVNSIWLRNPSFSPGQWAVDYAFLYTLYRVLNNIQPARIVEFGLGQTTVMINHYCIYTKATAYIFEHDLNWIEFFRKGSDLCPTCEIKLSKIQNTDYKGFKTSRYDLEIDKTVGGNIELIISDGPIGSPRYSRIQILDLLPDSINKENFCILFDDYQRIGEKDTSEEVMKILANANIKFEHKVYSGFKDHLLICSENNHFLTSL